MFEHTLKTLSENVQQLRISLYHYGHNISVLGQPYCTDCEVEIAGLFDGTDDTL